MKKDPLLFAKNLSRNFGAKEVLKGIDLSLYPQERIALLGENGVGKTTLLRVLASLSQKSSGEIFFNGIDLERNLPASRRMIGWVGTNEGGFVARFTGRENLFFFGALFGLTKAEILREMDSWKEWPIFAEALETNFLLCSSGMRQSLHLVRSMIHRPEILLWDEPFRSLGAQAKNYVQKRLVEMPHAPAVIFSTHSKEDIKAWATRCIKLRNGGLENVGTP